MKNIKRGILALAMAIGFTVGIGISIAAPAAAEGSYSVLYPVEASDVCRHQGHFGATSFNWYDAYSLTCYDLSVPAGVTFTGSLDIQGYCSVKYPGSTAMVAENNIWGWKCKREEAPPTS